MQPLIEAEPSVWWHTARMPSRSRLIRLKPRGVGTPFRESLSSYFLRLADAHSVSPNTLYRFLISPIVNNTGLLATGYGTAVWEDPCFNGLGMVPLGWTTLLESLTAIDELTSLCLLPLRGILPNRESASAIEKWCPLCLKEGEDVGAPFGQLLWKLNGVDACPLHKIKLMDKCGCSRGRLTSREQAKQLAHICKHCGCSLSRRGPDATVPATNEEINRAQLLGELLGSDLFTPGGEDRSPGISKFLTNAALTHADGNKAKLASILGKSKSAVDNWLMERRLPSLPSVVLIATTFNCSIRDILTGEVTSTQFHQPVTVIKSKCRASRQSREKVQSLLESMLQESVPVSLAEAARRIGIDRSGLARSQPAICRDLVSRWREYRHLNSVDLHRERAAVYKEVARRIASSGLRPTRRNITADLCAHHAVFDPVDREACDRACQEAIREFDLERD